METVARDMFVDLLLQPPVPLAKIGGALARFTPTSFKSALTSVVDTVKWLWSDDIHDTVLDMEVMRALQESHQRNTPSPSVVLSPTPQSPLTFNSSAYSSRSSAISSPPTSPVQSRSSPLPYPPKKRSGNRVRWSPVCVLINTDGAMEKSPLRPSAEIRGPRVPETSFDNVALFPLVSCP